MTDDQRNPEDPDSTTPPGEEETLPAPEAAPVEEASAEQAEQASQAPEETPAPEEAPSPEAEPAAEAEPAEETEPQPEATDEVQIDVSEEAPPPEADLSAEASAEAEAPPELDVDVDVDQSAEALVEAEPIEVRLAEDAASEPLPMPGGPGSHPAPFDPRQTPTWQALLAEYERELAAMGDVPAAAPLYYESGRILEEKLSQPHNAWDNYKKAFQLNPRLGPNIRAARRLASQMGNWNSTVLVLDSEIQATDDLKHKAHLYHRRGRILEEKLGKADEAKVAYEAAIECAPENVEILKQLERLAISTGDWGKVLEVRARLFRLIRDPAVGIQLLLSCARIYLLHFQDEQKAEEMYRQVLQMDPENLAALGALRTLYEKGKRHNELLDTMIQEARATAEPAIASWLYYRAAQLLRSQLGDDDRALECLDKALALSPGDHMVLAEMAHIFENLMRWQELVEIYDQQIQVIKDTHELVSLNFKLGNIWEEKLFNEDRAIEHYTKVVDLNPNYLPALQALGKLFYRKGQWDALVKMYEVEIKETRDAKQKAIKLYKLAEILEERLARDEDAMQKLEQSLQLNPGYLPGLKALGRLYNKYNRWESLIGMYENELESSGDQDQSIFLLDKIGTLWEEKQNNIDKAIETYQRLLEMSPNYLPAIRTLGKLYVRADRWEDMIRVNDLEAQLVNDQKQVVSLLHRNGEIYEEKLNAKDEAIEMYKKVLALAPSYLPALQSLGRLFFIKGRWEDLIAMHRQEIEVTLNEDQQIALLYKIGELYEQKLVQENKAIIAYQEVLRIRPTSSPAMKALIRIYSNKRDWENLIEICQQEAAALEDPEQKALSLFRVAEIWESHLANPEKAIDTLRQILQVTPNHAPAIRSLVRLYTQGEKWRELLEIFERELQHATHEAQQVQIMSRMAEIFTTRVNDLVRAAEWHEKILSIKPAHMPSIEALERIYLNQRNYASLVRIYDSYSTRTVDQRLQMSLQSQIADMKENRLQPPQNASENHLKVLSLDPQHPEAIRSLDILYHKFGTWKGLRLLYERELKRVRSVDEAADLCMRIADLAENRLGLPQVAVHYYQEVIRLLPDHLPALKALKRISLLQNDHQAMIGLLEREGQVTRDPRQAINTLLQAAQVYRESFNDPARAVECLFRVLERDPREVQAFSQLEALLIQQTDWERLAVLYRNRAGVTEDTRQLAELHLKLGGLMRERLERAQDAAESYRKVLEINPSSVPALSALAELAFGTGDWDTSIQLSLRLLDLSNEPVMLATCHSRLGIIFQEKKPDLDQAVMHFNKVLEQSPGDLASLQRLKAIHVARQQWNEAIQLIDKLVEVDTDPANRIKHYMEKAGIYETGIVDADKAVQAYQRVQELDPSNVSVIQKLGELYQRLERWQDLVDSYQAFIRLLPADRADDAIPLHLKMGRLFAEMLNNADKAILEYKRVVEINPRHAEAHEALADLYGKTGLYYANAVDEHRKLLEINPFRIDSYHEMRRIFEEQRAFDKVLCLCSVLHYLRAADQNEEFFYGENHGKVPERSTERLPDDEIEKLLIHPDEQGVVREIIKLIGHHLTKVYPPDLEKFGVGKGDKCRPDDPTRTLCDSIIANLGETTYDLYLSSQPTHQVGAVTTSPPSLIIGEGLIKRTVVKEQRFALGRAIKKIMDGSFLASLLGAQELARLIAAVVQPYHPGCPAATYPPGSLDDLPKRVAKAIPRKNRKLLEDLLRNRAPELARLPDYEAYLRGVEHSANRVGLMVGNDLSQAAMHLVREIPEVRDRRLSSTGEIAEALSPHPAICELLRFAVSEEYFRLRARMKFSIGV